MRQDMVGHDGTWRGAMEHGACAGHKGVDGVGGCACEVRGEKRTVHGRQEMRGTSISFRFGMNLYGAICM